MEGEEASFSSSSMLDFWEDFDDFDSLSFASVPAVIAAAKEEY